MQSPAGLVFRTLLLLGCLLVLPFVAVCGSSLPDVVQTALQGRWPSIGSASAKPDSGISQFVPATAPAAGGQETTTANRRQDDNSVGLSPSVLDRLAQIERRLQQLGASYYRLEEWGNQREFYRFSCDMAIGDDPNLARSFQAIRGDRVEAMTDVLGQIEAFCRR
jgi:hypothetical protein